MTPDEAMLYLDNSESLYLAYFPWHSLLRWKEYEKLRFEPGQVQLSLFIFKRCRQLPSHRIVVMIKFIFIFLTIY